MFELTGAGSPGWLAGLGIAEWVSQNPIIAAILVGLLALFFFFYLLVRRTVVEFKEGMKGNR